MFVRMFCLLSLATTGSLWAAPAQIKVYTEHFPPYQFMHKDKVVGINAELVMSVCQAAKVHCELELLPWKRSLQLTQSQPMSGLISTARNPQREEQFKWVGPLVNSTSYLYKLKHRTDIELTDLHDAARFTIGIQPNDIYESILLRHGFTKGKNLLNVSYKNADMQLFVQGKLDLIIGSPLTLFYQVEPTGFALDDLVETIEFPLGAIGNYMALNKAFPVDLQQRLQEQVDKSRASGEIDNLIRKYHKPANAQ
ncbi:ABC transporter substrate-binding protein [Bowmanella denitrificans]|uniref:ABC transporter substrate-binding protein n=2 Tax=Bowmanella denitrificans TaxID=366582 RepID=A0ABN0WY48_9ALTE